MPLTDAKLLKHLENDNLNDFLTPLDSSEDTDVLLEDDDHGPFYSGHRFAKKY